jgi:hypothetical protein
MNFLGEKMRGVWCVVFLYSLHICAPPRTEKGPKPQNAKRAKKSQKSRPTKKRYHIGSRARGGQGAGFVFCFWRALGVVVVGVLTCEACKAVVYGSWF